jgi:uncharacterized protein YdaU (DUF1376 family)
MGKPYMPLMMGDWIRGTRGMTAKVKGVYIGLLIHQYDNGFLPADMDVLTLIEPEVGSVWVSLKDKFLEFEPGKLRNTKLEEVRAFWNKQRNNGEKGGRPRKENPNDNPKPNPKDNHHTDLDLSIDIKLKESLDEIFISGQRPKWKHIDFEMELQSFCDKVRGDWRSYEQRDTGGIKTAFLYQLRKAKNKPKEKAGSENDEQTILNRIKNQKPQTNGLTSSPGGSLD